VHRPRTEPPCTGPAPSLTRATTPRRTLIDRYQWHDLVVPPHHLSTDSDHGVAGASTKRYEADESSHDHRIQLR
jgi:hypothetical protein